MSNRTRPKLTISISKKLNDKLEEGSYNKSKLVDNLLTEYFKKNKKQP